LKRIKEVKFENEPKMSKRALKGKGWTSLKELFTDFRVAGPSKLKRVSGCDDYNLVRIIVS
jgi:hypothetical protein